MMRKIGCCTWIFGPEPLADVAVRVSRAGLDGVELFGDVDGTDPGEAREMLGDHGLSVFSVTPGDADISHPDRSHRTAALAYYGRLMDWAAELGQPIISCHGQVARIKPVSTQEDEDERLADGVRQVCTAASKRGLTVVFEILNRYETHQVRTVEAGLALLAKVDAENLKLLPDAYHMNIEEADPAAAIRAGGDRIGLYHAADSNRCGIGDGNIDFASQIAALNVVGYSGPIILETNAPGPNPFAPVKGRDSQDIVEAQLARSVPALRGLGA